MLYRRGVIAAVRNRGGELFQAVSPADKLTKAKQLTSEVCALYGRPVPTVSLRMANMGGRRGECSDTGIVLYNSVGLTTLLHELYHWLCIGTPVGADETLARQWSVSLFIRALPRKAYRCLIPMGNVKFDRRNGPGRRLRRILPVSVPAPTPPVPAEQQA